LQPGQEDDSARQRKRESPTAKEAADYASILLSGSGKLDVRRKQESIKIPAPNH